MESWASSLLGRWELYFEAAERTESVGGFIVKAVFEVTPAMLSAGSLMSWGRLSCPLVYIDI